MDPRYLTAMVEHDCHSAISQLVAESVYCSFAAVTTRICFLRRIPSLQSLGVSLMDVPTLHRLFSIDQALDNFILGFAATRGVATLHDLEGEAVALLSSALIPPAPPPSVPQPATAAACPAAASTSLRAPSDPRAAEVARVNPDEIELLGDDDEGGNGNESGGASSGGAAHGHCAGHGGVDGEADDADYSFAQFGVGELTHHPIVQRIWRPPRGLVAAQCPGFADVAPFLMGQVLDAMTPASTAARAAGPPCDVAMCRDHLCACFEVESLGEIGVVLVDRALPNVLKAFRRTELKAYQLELRAQDMRMNEIHTATAAPPDDDGRRAEKRRRVEHAAAHPAPTALKLKQSESANVAALVDSCRVQLGTTYSPTFSKARDVIKELHQAASGKGKAKGGGGGKQTKGMPPLSKAAFLDVCTEYVMLHLGNTKWRARRWEGAPDPATVAGGGNGPAEDEDDAESESESSAAIGGRCSPAGTETERAGCSSSDDTDDASANDAHTDGAGDGAANAVGCAADTSAGPPATARSRSPSTSPAAVPSSSPPASAMACDAPGTGATPAGASGHGAPAQSAANGVNSRAVDPPGRMPTDGAIVVPTSAALGARVSLTSAAVAREGDFSSTWRVPGTALEAGPTIGSADLARVAAVPWSGHLALAPPALDVTDSRAVGRWGEALVYAYLVATTRNAVVEWVNEVGETRAPYDIVVTDRDGKWSRTRYIEVKTTRYHDRNVCELSAGEWAFASKEPRLNYDVYRVEGAGSPAGPVIYVVPDLAQLVTERKTRLCIAI